VTYPTSDPDRETDGPTVDQPLNARPRPRVSPVLAVIALVVVLGLLLLFILEVLVPAG
jgi:hypothetical protein